MPALDALIRRARRTQHGFKDLQLMAENVCAEGTPADSLRLARALLASKVPPARAVGTFILGMLAGRSAPAMRLLRLRVSRDSDWRVQEILAKAFDCYCREVGYAQALPVIEDWLCDAHPNVRRAASEGLRI